MIRTNTPVIRRTAININMALHAKMMRRLSRMFEETDGAGLVGSCHWLLVRVFAPRTPRGVSPNQARDLT
jgi:hypothetical protein